LVSQLTKEHRLRVLEGRVLRKMFRPKRDKITRTGKYCIMRSFMICRMLLSKYGEEEKCIQSVRSGNLRAETTWKT
jgi:hypothetical protein